jgi:hypothetical protein
MQFVIVRPIHAGECCLLHSENRKYQHLLFWVVLTGFPTSYSSKDDFHRPETWNLDSLRIDLVKQYRSVMEDGVLGLRDAALRPRTPFWVISVIFWLVSDMKNTALRSATGVHGVERARGVIRGRNRDGGVCVGVAVAVFPTEGAESGWVTYSVVLH